MAKKGNIFDNQENFKLEEATSLGSLEDGFIFQVNRYNVFYSEQYDAPMLVIEAKDGEVYYSFSEFIVERLVKAINIGFTQKNKVYQVKHKIAEESQNAYVVLTTPSSDDLNEFKIAQFESKNKKEKR